MNILMEIKGHNGQLIVTENKIIIKRKGLLGFLSNGSGGDKEIPIKSITAIQFKLGNFIGNGQIQFSIQGETSNKGRGISVSDENTVIFTKSQNEVFQQAKKMIEELMTQQEKSGSTIITQNSNADELKKFAELKDQGLITEEEFNKKKKDLLGL